MPCPPRMTAQPVSLPTSGPRGPYSPNMRRKPDVDAPPSGDHARYLGAVRRMVRAAGRRVAEADPEDLAELLALQAAVDRALAEAVTGQRAAGTSWAAIGAALGMTKQAAYQRWGRGAA